MNDLDQSIPGSLARFAGGMVQSCAGVSIIFVSIASAPLHSAEPTVHGGVSKHISDAILTDFRGRYSVSPAPVTAVSEEVEPGVVLLPAFRVVDEVVPVKLTPEDVVANPRESPRMLGSGIIEHKGRKFTTLTQTLFYLPIGWKIAW